MTSYATVDELLTRLEGQTEIDADVYEAYQKIIAAYSAKIDELCRRPDGFVATTTATARHLMGTGTYYIEIPECIEVTAVAVKDSYDDTVFTSWTAPSSQVTGDGDYYPIAGTPGRPTFDRTPYTYLVVDPNGEYNHFTKAIYLPTVKVTAKRGYAATAPYQIREATLAEAAKFIKRFQGGMDVRLASADLGVMIESARQSGLTREVKELLVESMFVLPLYGGALR